MTNYIIIIASFDQLTGKVSYDFQHDFHAYREPERVTLGFRQVFWKCFSRIRASQYDDVEIDWLGRHFRLEAAIFYESMGTALAETEGDLFIASFVVTLPDEEAVSFHGVRAAAGLNEQETIFALLAALPASLRQGLTDRLKHSLDFPGLSVFQVPAGCQLDIQTDAILYGFFYWAKLLLWRVRRDQADINISIRQKNFKDAIFLTAIQRSRLINIKRFQLTSNISNDPEAGVLAREMKKSLNLEAEYQNDEELNTLFENHLAALEKLFSEENRRRVEVGVAVFSFIAVPFTVLGALLTLNTDAAIVRETLQVLSDNRVLLLILLSAVMPMLIYLAALLRRERSVEQRLAAFRSLRQPARKSR